MAWVLTKQLQAFRDQMDATFPNRDRKSDGVIGDAAHQAEKSGHNPDRTANAEYKDGDSKNEVRAIDIDSDTGNPDVSMEGIVQHLVRLARAGKLSFIRYLIFNRRIWAASSGWAQRAYTGPSPHTEHLHMSGAYNQSADENADADYHLEDLVGLSDADKKWITAQNEAVKEWLRGNIGYYAMGFDPGPKKDANGKIVPGPDGEPQVSWPGVQDIWHGNGETVAPGTALGTILNWAKSDHEDIAKIIATLPQLQKALDIDVPTADENAAAVLAAIRDGSAAGTAAALKIVLGDQAAEVGRLLASA